MTTCKRCKDSGRIYEVWDDDTGVPCPDCNSGEPKGSELDRILADGDPDLMHLQTVETRLRYHEEAVKALTQLVSDLIRVPGPSVHPARQRRLGTLLGRCGIDSKTLRHWDCKNLGDWTEK